MHEEKLRTMSMSQKDEKESLERNLTEEEVAVYDRQIRLWGVESQKRLRKARILICGMNSLGNEVAKNIVLAGVEHMTVLDNTILTEDEKKIQFLPSTSGIGQNKAQAACQRLHEMNPMVDLVIDMDDISEKSDSFFEKFDIVCLLGYSKHIQLKVNEICHNKNIKFLSGCVFGFYGYMFSDLCKHQFVEEKTKVDKVPIKSSNEPAKKKQKLNSEEEEDAKEMVEKTVEFTQLSSALSTKATHGFSLKQIKNVSKAYFVMQVLLEFSSRKGRYPDLTNKTNDWQELIEIRDTVFEQLQVDNEMLPDTFVSNCIGEITPVSCIVGGILAQEIIKAVSGRDAPHNNFFFFDGMESTGLVDHFGVTE